MKSNTGQTIRRLKAENKQLRIGVVKQQRELLLAFWNYALENDLENVVRPMSKDVNEFLANYNS